MAAAGAGRGAAALPADRPKARDSSGPEGPTCSFDPKAPPGSPSPSRVISPRTIGPKEGGREDAGLSKGRRGPLPHPRCFRGGASFCGGAVTVRRPGAQATGRRLMEGSCSWSRCGRVRGAGSIRRQAPLSLRAPR
jgi:hypothetical protein